MSDHNNRKVTAAVETVTPARAEEWLGKNTSNRNMRFRVVSAYARDMQNGAWQLTGEPVKFSANGRLLDGQHRLHAVVEAGVPVDMLVVRGLPDGTQSVMDSGARRTAGDALKLRGEVQYSHLAAAARLGIAFIAGEPLGGNRGGGGLMATHTEILKFVDDHADLREAVALAAKYRNAIDMPPSVLSISAWVLARIDAEGLEIFLAQLAEKTGLRRGDAVLALINRLGEIRRTGRQATNSDYMSLMFRAWNYWRTNTEVDSLPLRKSGGEIAIPVPR